jgi:hypothetical protein
MQAIACSACICVGVHRITASMSGSASASDSSVPECGASYLAATSAACSARREICARVGQEIRGGVRLRSAKRHERGAVGGAPRAERLGAGLCVDEQRGPADAGHRERGGEAPELRGRRLRAQVSEPRRLYRYLKRGVLFAVLEDRGAPVGRVESGAARIVLEQARGLCRLEDDVTNARR